VEIYNKTKYCRAEFFYYYSFVRILSPSCGLWPLMALFDGIAWFFYISTFAGKNHKDSGHKERRKRVKV